MPGSTGCGGCQRPMSGRRTRRMMVCRGRHTMRACRLAGSCLPRLTVAERSRPNSVSPRGWCGAAGLFAREVVATVWEHPVDVVLAEAVVAGVLVGAEATGLPTAALMPNIYLRPAPGLPQFGTGWSPTRGPLGRGRDALVALAV